VETSDIDDLVRHFSQDDRVWAIANLDRLDELPPEIRQQLDIVALTKASRRKVALIVTRPIAEERD
jgi:hypothetical protein